jgi:hypothetical protein
MENIWTERESIEVRTLAFPWPSPLDIVDGPFLRRDDGASDGLSAPQAVYLGRAITELREDVVVPRLALLRGAVSRVSPSEREDLRRGF